MIGLLKRVRERFRNINQAQQQIHANLNSVSNLYEIELDCGGRILIAEIEVAETQEEVKRKPNAVIDARALLQDGS